MNLAAGNKKGPEIPYNVFRKAVKYLHEQGEFTPAMLEDQPLSDLTQATYKALLKGMDYGIRDNEIPAAMAAKLDDDVFVFSGCKTYHELKEASLLLRDEKGKVKPFEAFRREVDAIHENYNRNYLEAEYDFAVSAAQSAAKWADIASDGDEYDLQYRTAGDNRVRADHAALNGTTLPPSHPFWDSYMPPNGWRCRCQAIQVLRGKYPRSDGEQAIKNGEEATTQLDSQDRNRAAMFRFNPGKQQVIFPLNHPYRKAVPQEAVTAIKKIKQQIDYKLLESHSGFNWQLNYVREECQKVATELTEYQKAAIRYYSGSGYIDINRLAGKYKLKEISSDKEFIRTCSDLLETALKKSKAKYRGVSYRGARLSEEQVAKYKEALRSSQPVCEETFLSTSYDSTSAFSGNVFYQIKSKRGVKIENLSEYESEKEVLFNRGTEFQVVKVEERGGKTFIELEEL